MAKPSRSRSSAPPPRSQRSGKRAPAPPPEASSAPSACSSAPPAQPGRGTLVLTALGLMVGYLATLALPWGLYVVWGPFVAVVTALAVAGGWLAVSGREPLGFKLGPFVLGALINLVGTFFSWVLHWF